MEQKQQKTTRLKFYSVSDVLVMKHKTFELPGAIGGVFGAQEPCGIWLIYGAEKSGKTWLALKLADMLTDFAKVLYVSAEEGVGENFKKAIKRAGIDFSQKKLQIKGYSPLSELGEYLHKQRSAGIVLIDNCSVYNDEFRGINLLQWAAKFPKKLFIFLAHEENKLPYPALGRTLRRFAKVIVRVQGFNAQVSGRCPGGTITIDEQQAGMIWGSEN